MRFLLLIALGAIVAQAEDQALKEFADRNIIFTSNVYKELIKSQSGNVLVCPLSVNIILSLVHAGAKGNTAKQLSTGLQLPESTEEIQETYKKLAPKLQGNSEYSLSSANKVYVKDGFEISPSFKDVATNTFKAGIENLDFTKNVAAANIINKWVEEQTDSKIKDLIESSDLDADTRAVLVNAMYFKGSWIHAFSEYATKKKPFFLNNQQQVEVDMMEITEGFNYYEDEKLNAKFLEVPYKGDDVTMTFVLPNDKEGLPALEAKIADALVTPPFEHQRVHVQIPKFKIESTIQFKPILQTLGIIDAFEGTADFSGIGAKGEQLTISKVIQKAFIEVDEKGTTAAAATAVFVPLISPGLPIPEPKTFIADHCFIYYLKSQAGIMFLGRFTQG